MLRNIANKTARRDNLTAAAWEGGLLGAVALLGWAVHAPLIVTCLGPTAYEIFETPERPSARLYDVLMGHTLGVLAGLLAVWVCGATHTPAISLTAVPLRRVACVLVASMLTVLGTLLLRAAQPSAISTTLLVALGTLQGVRGLGSLAAGVLLITAAAEPVRRARLRARGVKESL